MDVTALRDVRMLKIVVRVQIAVRDRLSMTAGPRILLVKQASGLCLRRA